MVNMCAKLDENAHNSFVFIVFKKSKCEAWADGTTEALLNPFCNV